MSEEKPPVITKECPFCAESIPVQAKKCKHCGETIDVTLRIAEDARRAAERQNQNLFVNNNNNNNNGNGANNGLRPFSHTMHAILSIFTGGCWLPVWVLLYLLRDKQIYY